MSFDLGLSSRRALVTAGTKGIGAAVVEVLRENGANVSWPYAPCQCVALPRTLADQGFA